MWIRIVVISIRTLIRIGIKIEIRIRIGIKTMPIHNTGCAGLFSIAKVSNSGTLQTFWFGNRRKSSQISIDDIAHCFPFYLFYGETSEILSRKASDH
jgi:hypothetical protein